MLDSTKDFLDLLAKVLLRCWILGFASLALWFGLYMLGGDVLHRLHSDLFGMSVHELNVIHYCGMGLLKLFVFVCFLFPWVAIKMALRKDKG